MASMTMTASFLGGSSVAAVKNLPTASRRGVVAVRASRDSEEKMVVNNAAKVEESNNGRRELMFAVAAAAACSVAKVAMADEPKRGSPEAKKKYGPICVTMPTARICRN
ncbi:photosystem ii 5 kDa protein chloroplastic [Phtheirospermum japonicum]|uniref:Photosystem ii 5 kDa protein chloroplastic n=1 Tax=Phtheirospermum japonicum TaxID=374723 RepID=A0A830CUV4_9LAMI|nr:photosystem ii 5 kDa protein chloroplastic [Phtheirospermum japonicum]